MERLLRAALAATMSTLLVAGGSLALTQAGPDDLATLQAAPWTLSELDGESIDPSAGITAAFEADGSLSGFAGCNSYNSDYTTDGAILTVGPIASTRKACDDATTANENIFLDLLQNAATWSLDSTVLTITATDGGTLVFGDEVGEPAAFAGTDWQLASISGQDVPAGIGANAIFGEDFSVAGNAGCNTFSGDYSVDGDSIVIGPLAATRKACEPDVMDVENAFLNGLEQVSTMAISGQTLTLTSSDGSVQLVLTAGGGSTAGVPFAGTAWSVVDLDGEPAVTADGMTVSFGEDGTIDGFGGCNTMFGDYSIDGDALTVTGLAATRKFCDQDLMDRESLLIAILTDAQTATIDGDELTITAASGAELILQAGTGPIVEPTPEPVETPEPVQTPEPVATTAPATGEIVGPTWVLTSLMDQPMPVGIIDVTIVFNADGTVSGNGSCTPFSGTYTLDGTSLSMAGIETEGECTDATKQGIQDGILQVLPFMDTAEVIDGTLHLDSSFGIQSEWTVQ
jgi:heat shock protein HslJ